MFLVPSILIKGISSKFFSFLQDNLLKQLVSHADQLGSNLRWDVISSHFPDRSDVQCQQRWAKVVNPELVKGPWTKEVCFKNLIFKLIVVCNSSS